MTPDIWQQVKELYRKALEHAPIDRAAFLDGVCGGDQTLRHEVESLIASHEEAGTGFLEQPAFALAAGAVCSEAGKLAAGQRVGRYEVLGSLGAGGMGEVYLAYDTRLARKVALKLLRFEWARDTERRARFEQEARAVSALNHPSVCTIFESGETEQGQHYIAMEYVQGESLRERLARGRFDVDRALDVAIQVASALVAAHDAGIVHRDIKPENVMVRTDGLIKVVDFGLAKLTDQEHPIDSKVATRGLVRTGSGMVIGTATYMSPEQARGLVVDARTDTWSLGVVLYEMVTGHVPFVGDTTSDVIVAILEHVPPQISHFVPTTPVALERVVTKALRKDRDERYQSATELRMDLESLRRRHGVGDPRERTRRSDASRTDDAARAQEGRAAHQLAGIGQGTAGITRKKRGALLGLVALVVVAAGITWGTFALRDRLQVSPSSLAPPQRALSRLTFDAGLQIEPTWSPDGRLIAYSADRGGNLDIWIQSVAGGDAVQVTRSPAHDWQPDWSPDGSQIVFRSERDGGGLFVVPALGGNERKIASFGYRPRWSPDGSQILFTNGMYAGYEARVYVVTLDGGPPREVLAELLKDAHVYSICWHPDGKRVTLDVQYNNDSEWDLSTVPLDGGTPVGSGFYKYVREHSSIGPLSMDALRWSPTGRALYVEADAQGIKNLWKFTVDPETLQVIAGPDRLTTGPGIDTDIALSRDGTKLAFITRTEVIRACSLAFNARTGKVTGDDQPITAPGMNPVGLRLSPDGKDVMYIATRAGSDRRELWKKSLEDGQEALLAGYRKDAILFNACWSRDSERVAYYRFRWLDAEHTQWDRILVVLSSGGDELVVDAGKSQVMPWDWSVDGQYILASSDRDGDGQFGELGMVPIRAAPHAGTRMRVIASHPEYSLFQASISPDNNWVCFIAVRSNGSSTVYVVPISGGAWTQITDDGIWSDKPRWAPDGKTIYFVANRGSPFLNVWGIRFDPVEGKPAGEAFQVTSLESPRKTIWSSAGDMEISLTDDRLVLPIVETAGSVWMLEHVDQ